jgi:Flp pilus assembly protein TadD
MPFDPIDREASRARPPASARARWIILGSLLAACAVLGAGCVVTPRQPASSAPSSPPQVPENASGAEVASQIQPAGAASEFHAKATDRQSFQVHIDFGRVFEAQGNFDGAVLEYQDAITFLETRKRGPFQPGDRALAHRRMAGALDRLGRFAQAEVHYQKALKFSPKDPKVWNDAGYSYYLQSRWSDAEKALRTAAKLAPDDERIRINLGLTLAAAGKTSEALPLLSLSSGDPSGHANLGYLLAATGQFDLARRQYETALAMRPDMELARRALARLDRQQQGSDLPDATDHRIATNIRSTARPVDLQVKPAARADSNIPPPRVRSFIPQGARAPAALLDAPVTPSGERDAVNLNKLPPPPPL